MDVLAEAQLILTVTSAVHDVIQPGHLRPGSVVCDVARPRDVSAMVAATRDDILVIDGGMVDVPGPVDFHFNFGFPPGKAYACMAETMALALEGRFEDYTLGKHLTRARVDEITAIAKKHGFRLSGFRSFEQEVTEQQIEAVRRKRKCPNCKAQIILGGSYGKSSALGCRRRRRHRQHAEDLLRQHGLRGGYCPARIGLALEKTQARCCRT